MMKKTKGKLELRYYDIPQNDYLIALTGDNWKMAYGKEDSQMHFHNILELGICREGEGELLVNEEIVRYEPGTLTMFPPNFLHKTVSDDNKSFWEYIFIDVDKVVEREFSDDPLVRQKIVDNINKCPIVDRKENLPVITNKMEMIITETKNKNELFRESVKGIAVSLVTDLFRHNFQAGTFEEISTRNRFTQIKPALEYIKDNYASNMKIAEIADVCHMSESHFRRLFEENVGMTPIEYLNQVRVNKSCDLIKKTSYSMEEIALKVGFATTSTFNRNFKRIIGTSPYQWKKKPDNYETKLSNVDVMIEKGWNDDSFPISDIDKIS